jgi:glucokinase
MSMVGAVDIGGTKIAVGAVRADGTIAHRSECPTEPHRGFSNTMDKVRYMLRNAVGISGNFDGIGIACPGPLDPYTGVVGNVGTLPGWEGGDLVAELATEFGVTVAVENDADAAALAEFNWGATQSTGTFIFVTISTGIGGGIILGGQLYRGVGRAHPELGHQVLDNSGPLCYCSARGCWESLASGTAMSNWMQERSPNSGQMTAEQICDLAAQRDPLAMQAVTRHGYYLGLGLANLVTLFAPECIALGGGVMKSRDLFLEDAIRVVRKLCTQVPVERVHIVPASLGHEAGLLGAAQAWISRYRHSP